MTSEGIHNPSTFECVDEHPEYVIGEERDTAGGRIFFVRPRCDQGAGCGPYREDKVLTCVVCTK